MDLISIFNPNCQSRMLQISLALEKDGQSKYCRNTAIKVSKSKSLMSMLVDNLSLHKNDKTLRYLENKNLTVYFLPVGSSFLNPAEHLWSLIKYKWSKTLSSFSDA